MSIVPGTKITTIMVSAANGDTYGDAERRLFRGLQTLMMPNVINATTNTPPGAPVSGDTYIVGSVPTGAWATHANQIAYWAIDPQDGVATTGIWEFYVPQAGWSAYNQATGSYVTWTGSAWAPPVVVPNNTVVNATSSATINPALGNSFLVNLTANLTSLTIPAGQNGQMITILWKQDATGGWTITYPANVASIGFVGGAGTLSAVDLELLTADQYVVLGASGVSNTGSSTISGGNVGSFPTNSITGAAFAYTPPAATVTAIAQNQIDLLAAITFYQGLGPGTVLTTADMGTQNGGGGAGVYHAGTFSSASSLAITTAITLDAQGNPNAQFVFLAGSTITQQIAGTITLINGAQASNVVWVAGSSWTSIGPGATTVGDILAVASVTLGGGTLVGRALAHTGSVTIGAAEFISVPAAVPAGAFHAQPSPTPNSVSAQTFTYSTVTSKWYQTALGTYGL